MKPKQIYCCLGLLVVTNCVIVAQRASNKSMSFAKVKKAHDKFAEKKKTVSEELQDAAMSERLVSPDLDQGYREKISNISSSLDKQVGKESERGELETFFKKGKTKKSLKETRLVEIKMADSLKKTQKDKGLVLYNVSWKGKQKDRFEEVEINTLVKSDLAEENSVAYKILEKTLTSDKALSLSSKKKAIIVSVALKNWESLTPEGKNRVLSLAMSKDVIAKLSVGKSMDVIDKFFELNDSDRGAIWTESGLYGNDKKALVSESLISAVSGVSKAELIEAVGQFKGVLKNPKLPLGKARMGAAIGGYQRY